MLSALETRYRQFSPACPQTKLDSPSIVIANCLTLSRSSWIFFCFAAIRSGILKSLNVFRRRVSDATGGSASDVCLRWVTLSEVLSGREA